MGPPRSLADDLRRRDDAALGRLLHRRPDLLRPVPSDITALTIRSATGPSVSRCLDGMDALHLYLLRIAADLTGSGPASADAIIQAATAELPTQAAPECLAALHELIEAAVIWGEPQALHAVNAVRDLVATSSVPIWPRPGLHPSSVHEQHGIDAQAALHARESLAQIRDLLDDWSIEPPTILRSGGLSLRDFAAATRSLHATPSRASLTIEVAHAARLVTDDHEAAPRWIPTDHYDAWLARSAAEQWIEIVTAWLQLPRLASLADERTQVLSADRDRGAIPTLRQQTLTLLADMPAGEALSLETIIAVLDDRQPRRAGELRQLSVAATLQEAGDLGLTAAGAMSSAGRLLMGTSPTTATGRAAQEQQVAAALHEALPTDIDHVTIQADHTIIAPGPLAASVSRSLRLVSDVESRGHATVFRISEDSIRRALDAGWDAASIRTLLDDISRTPVPQPIGYLIDDVARRHGAVRVGNALAYLRCDNAETLSAILGDRRLRSLGLSRIADTVLACQSPASELLPALRETGYSPAAESPDGQVLVRRPEDQRIAAPRKASVTTRRMSEDALVTAAIRALRSGDEASLKPRGATVAGPAGRVDLPSLSSAAIIAALRAGIADNQPLWIGYADTDGTVTQQIVDPIRLHGGVLTAFDHRTEQVTSFAVSRVTGVAGLDLPPPSSVEH